MTKVKWSDLCCCKHDFDSRGFCVLGLSKTRKYDMVFSKVELSPITASNGLISFPHYRLHPVAGKNRARRLPKSLTEVMSQNEYENLIFDELVRIQAAANEKVARRGVLLEKNPYRLLFGRVGRAIGRGMNRIVRYLADDMCFGSELLALPIAAPLVYVYLAIVLVICTILFFFVDLLSCKVWQRGCPNDRAYITRFMSENPSLDTLAIDTCVWEELKQVVNRLQEKYPHYHIYFQAEVMVIPEGKHLEEVDLFLICFQDHSSTTLTKSEESRLKERKSQPTTHGQLGLSTAQVHPATGDIQ